MKGLVELARERDLLILEDAAQSPGATHDGFWPGHGTKGAVYSFNQHKPITSGEGGLLVSDEQRVLDIAGLMRNHAESVVSAYPDIPQDMIGWNYRLTEVEAAIARCQTDKRESLTSWRVRLAGRLTDRIAEIPGLTPPHVLEGNTHVYFTYPVLYDASEWGIPRELFVEALRAEGVPCAAGYAAPLHRLPAFRTSTPVDLSTCERLADEALVLIAACRWPVSDDEIDQVGDALGKCWDERDALTHYARKSSDA
jgi:dTDP-4-amino-4,6-dideoxygalactose transaminase